MPRGRQHYDPIVQAPMPPADEILERVELYPEADGEGNIARWVARRINSDGLIAEYAPGDANHDGAYQQAVTLWPGLVVYELHDERDDTTWTGRFGPSPRLWQQNIPVASMPAAPAEMAVSAVDDVDGPPDGNREAGAAVEFPGVRIDHPGVYVRLEDCAAQLRQAAEQYDLAGNPSAALALREAAHAWTQ